MFSVLLDGGHSSVRPTIKKMRLSHHSNESWNPDKLLVTLMLLDSILRWNDEVWGIYTIIGQTHSCPPDAGMYENVTGGQECPPSKSFMC